MGKAKDWELALLLFDLRETLPEHGIGWKRDPTAKEVDSSCASW